MRLETSKRECLPKTSTMPPWADVCTEESCHAGGIFLVMGNMATQYSLAFIGELLAEACIGLFATLDSRHQFCPMMIMPVGL